MRVTLPIQQQSEAGWNQGYRTYAGGALPGSQRCQQGNGGSLPSPPWGAKTNSCRNCTNKVDYDKTVGYHRLLCLLSTKDWKNLFPQVVLWGHCHRAKKPPSWNTSVSYGPQPKSPDAPAQHKRGSIYWGTSAPSHSPPNGDTVTRSRPQQGQ